MRRIEVPSPTFTLMQTYDLPAFPLVHADLYRLSGAAELDELGFDDLPDGAVVLLEWPDRAAGLLPPDRLDIELTLAPKLKIEFRHARVTGYGSFAPRVERIAAVRQFIAESGYSEAQRRRMQGDASTRSYERMTLGSKHVILMNSPRRPDGPPVRDGKPYSAIAHLADNVMPFVAMAEGLRAHGLSAPDILPRRSRTGTAAAGGSRRRSAWSRAIRRRRSRSATRPPSTRCCICMAQSAAGRAAGRAARRISTFHPTTWRRS